MAHIKADAEVTLSTADAMKLVRNAAGKVRFQVRVSALLPTGDGRGFEGVTFISISRSEMVRVIRDICSPTLEGRGATISLKLTAPSGYGDLSFVSLF